MAESGSTRITLATCSGTSLRRCASSDVDEILAEIDRDAGTFIHIVQTSTAVTARVLEHFGLPQTLAEHIDGGAELELDTSSDRYLFKKFRFLEERTAVEAAPREMAGSGILIRDAETDRLTEGNGSFVCGETFVLLFDPQASPLLGRAVATALHRERELRERGLEYLLYRLVKTVLVDNYLLLMRRLLDRLQDLEPPLLDGSTDSDIYREVTGLRRELNPFERSLIHIAEFTAEVAGEKPAIQGGLRSLAANLEANRARLEKEFSMLRDRSSALIEMYRDNVSAQLNNVMRSLTVISAMFLPLSFITSFYGMNFTNMPAFTWPGGFVIAVALMLAIAVGALTYARRKKWL